MELQTVVCLLWIFGSKSWSVIGNDEDSFVTAKEVEPDFKRLENEYAIGNVTTSTTEGYDNGTSSGVIAMAKTREVQPISVGVFKPSVHLGEIEEFRSAGENPFNKVEHIKFENFISVTPDTTSWQSVAPENGRITIFGKDSATQSAIPDNEDYRRPNEDASFFRDPFKFQGQFAPSTNHWIKLPETTSKDTTITTTTTAHFVKDFPMIFEQPANFHSDFNFVTPFSDPQISEIRKPSSFEKYGPPVSGTEGTTFAKNQHFPYQFYQESSASFEGGSANDKFVVPPVLRNQRISPWKKIIKLIGSILPFGLLLASLSPKVVQIGSSTQSSIPLSKFKEINLPPEHKSMRMAEDLYSCEDRDICEMIVEGSKPESNMMQNVLWNLVSRAPEETTRDNELRKLFRAVKGKDCSLLTC